MSSRNSPELESISDDSMDQSPLRDPDSELFSYRCAGYSPIQIMGSDYNRLKDDDELNDNLIVFYMRYCLEKLRQNNEDDAKRYYLFDSFFYQKLSDMNSRNRNKVYETMSRWIKVDLLEFRYIFVPICEDQHWYLVQIINPAAIINNPPDCHIAVYDSIAPKFKHSSAVRILKNLLIDYVKDVKGKIIPKSVRIPHSIVNTPKQLNTVDCGVYILHFIETFMENSSVHEQKIVDKETDEDQWNPTALPTKRQTILEIIKNIEAEYQTQSC
ncbi:cysteine proteinase [Gigaspora margarita]|uniref:Cysteine proteinase n=1 Tax=Gigaspora margarita TaxID=4874 RepID=A0A8H4A087_GIGMA|nr:cysteine proteinase [Gigaspora margarita]